MRSAAKLRHEQTPAECRLWTHLRTDRMNGISFRRQHAIGPYIVDFCSPRGKLVIEVDGSQHLNKLAYDAKRTTFLSSQGYAVLRFQDGDVMNNIEDVLTAILEKLLSMGIISDNK
jgi:very-short-patch-repair endonuclease